MKKLIVCLFLISQVSFAQEILTCNQLQVGWTDHAACDFVEAFNEQLFETHRHDREEVKIVRSIDICDGHFRYLTILDENGKEIMTTNNSRIDQYVSRFSKNRFVKIEEDII